MVKRIFLRGTPPLFGWAKNWKNKPTRRNRGNGCEEGRGAHPAGGFHLLFEVRRGWGDQGGRLPRADAGGENLGAIRERSGPKRLAVWIGGSVSCVGLGVGVGVSGYTQIRFFPWWFGGGLGI